MEAVSRKSRAAKGSAVAVLQYALQFILQLALAPLILSLAGQETLGAYAILVQILGYLSLFQMGIGVSVSRALSQAFGYEDKGRYFRSVLNTARAIQIVSGCLYLLCTVIISRFLDLVVTSNPALMEQLRLGILIMGGWTAIRSIFQVYGSALLATQDLARANLVGLGGSVCRLFCTVIFLFHGFGLISLVLAGIVSEAIVTLLNYLSFTNLHRELKCRWSYPSLTLAIPLLRMSAHGLAMSISWRMVAGSDSLVVGAMLGASAASVYYSTQLPTIVGYTLVNQIADNAAPAWNELHLRANREYSRSIFITLHRYALIFSSMLAVGLVLLNRPFIYWWLGPQQYGGDLMTVCLAAFAVMITTTKVNQTYILITGKMKGLTTVLLLEGGVNLVLSFVLCRALGLSGVMLGTVLAHTITLSYSQRSAMFSLHVRLSDYLRQSLRPVLAPAFMGLIVALPFMYFVPPTSASSLFLVALVLVAAHLGTSYFTCLDHAERSWVHSQIRGVLAHPLERRPVALPLK